MQERELSRKLEQGMTLQEIADEQDCHPSTVSYWMEKYGLTAVHSARHRARGAIDRELITQLVERGLSITELAETLDRSKATVRHWLKRYGLTTRRAVRRAQLRAIRIETLASGEAPPASLVLNCRTHGDTTFVYEVRGYYRCARCRAESVAAHRRRLKETLVAEAGGRCVVCGYDRRPRALEFHHLDRAAKEFALSRRGVTLSLDALRAEAKKCVLLCSNCHAEVEDGVVEVSIE